MYDSTMNPLYNPMINPYYGQQAQITQQPRREVVKVNGENGARAFPMGANSSALLLDESGVIVWLVTTDGAGYKSVAPFDITPHQTAPAPDFGSLEERIKRLEEKVNAAAYYSTDAARRPAERRGPRTDKASYNYPAKSEQPSDGITAAYTAEESGDDAGA